MTTTLPILVAYDGSPDAQRALRVGGTRIAPDRRADPGTGGQRGAATCLGRCSGHGRRHRGLVLDSSALLERAEDLPGRRREWATPTIQQRSGHVVGELLRAAASASAVVIGSRGHGRAGEALLGSVSQHIARHATCPVVVVREPQEQGHDASWSASTARRPALRRSTTPAGGPRPRARPSSRSTAGTCVLRPPTCGTASARTVETADRSSSSPRASRACAPTTPTYASSRRWCRRARQVPRGRVGQRLTGRGGLPRARVLQRHAAGLGQPGGPAPRHLPGRRGALSTVLRGAAGSCRDDRVPVGPRGVGDLLEGVDLLDGEGQRRRSRCPVTSSPIRAPRLSPGHGREDLAAPEALDDDLLEDHVARPDLQRGGGHRAEDDQDPVVGEQRDHVTGGACRRRSRRRPPGVVAHDVADPVAPAVVVGRDDPLDALLAQLLDARRTAYESEHVDPAGLRELGQESPDGAVGGVLDDPVALRRPRGSRAVRWR